MGKRNSNLPTMLQRVQLRRGEIFQRAQRRFRFTDGQLVVRRFHDSEIKKKERNDIFIAGNNLAIRQLKASLYSHTPKIK